jgi:hypothetical protein
VGIVQTYPSGEKETPVLVINLLFVLQQVDAQYKGEEKLLFGR